MKFEVPNHKHVGGTYPWLDWCKDTDEIKISVNFETTHMFSGVLTMTVREFKILLLFLEKVTTPLGLVEAIEERHNG